MGRCCWIKRWFTEASEEPDELTHISSKSAAAVLAVAIRLTSLDKKTRGIVPGNHWAGGKVFYSRISERIHASWIHMVRKTVRRARRKYFSRII